MKKLDENIKEGEKIVTKETNEKGKENIFLKKRYKT